MTIRIDPLEAHKKSKGKIAIVSKMPLETSSDLAIAYTPGVAEPCKEIAKDVTKSYDYTSRGNMVAVISDGTAVLGLGDIGPEAAMPVMEGKAALFKTFADVDAFPLCIATKNVDEIVSLCKWLEPSFGGINLEDIAAPRCFEIEERLKKELNIPVFHDDQHGTAIVTLAGLLNAAKVVNKPLKDLRIVFSGAGAAGLAITKLLQYYGITNIIICDSKGAIYEGRDNLHPVKQKLAMITNTECLKGNLADVLHGADVFIGVSKPGVLTAKMIKTMAKDPIVFAMANPVPEIFPEEAESAGAAVIATGRSDFPNQINNVLVFPGIFRGVLDARIHLIDDDMKIAVAEAIAQYISIPTPHCIIPPALDKNVAKVVAKAVKDYCSK
jgi:malate dehydrogenase (oxaloacetate-decarboxylating)